MRIEEPVAVPSVAVSAREAVRLRLIYPAAALSGFIMVCAFPRCGQDWLIWVSLVPLFWAAAGAGAGRGFLLGLLTGLPTVFGGFSWVLYSMHAFTGMGPLAGLPFWAWCLFESLPWAVLGLGLGLLRSGGRPAPGRVLLVLPFWVGVEHFFPHLFPWHMGAAFWTRSWLLNCADLLGASGLTALIFLVNAVVFLLLRWWWGGALFPARTLAAAAALLVAANAYGALRLRHVEAELAKAPELRVGFIQPVTPPEEKTLTKEASEKLIAKMLGRTMDLSRRERLDLVLWPEGADPLGFYINRNGVPLRSALVLDGDTGLGGLDVPLIAGTWSLNIPTEGRRNTAEFVLPKKWPPRLYDKNNRLLFGEYVPLLDSLPSWLRERIGYIGTIEAGVTCPRFELPARNAAFAFRILICYEAVLPEFVRKAAKDADFLANVTEDIWYGRTSHVPQHLSVLVLRAVENRLPIARAANCGPSGVIDQTGATSSLTKDFEPADAVFSMRLARLGSLYNRAGFAFPGVCLALGVFLVAREGLRGRRGAPSRGR